MKLLLGLIVTGSLWAQAIGVGSIGISGGGGGGSATPAFSTLTSGTNAGAAMIVGTGASLTVSGSGTINATSLGGDASALIARLASPTFSGTVTIGTTTLSSSGSTLVGVTDFRAPNSTGRATTTSHGFNGTFASPTQTVGGDVLWSHTAYGYNAVDGFIAGPSISMQAPSFDGDWTLTGANPSTVVITVPDTGGEVGGSTVLDMRQSDVRLMGRWNSLKLQLQQAVTQAAPENIRFIAEARSGQTVPDIDLSFEPKGTGKLKIPYLGTSSYVCTGSASDLLTSGCPAFAVANGGTGLTSGTSGGVLAYTASSTMVSSGELTANLPVIGGGAGAAPGVGTRSGNTTAFVTTTGAQTSGDCVKIDANGNHIASGGACGGSSGGNHPYFTQSCVLAQNSTGYLKWQDFNTQNCGASESAIGQDYTQQLEAETGSLKNLRCSLGATTPGSGQSITYTIRTGTPGSGSDTAVTCVIADSATSCSDTTHTGSSTAGNFASVKAVTTSGTGNLTSVCVFENVF